MKKLLYILLFLQIISGVFIFFMLIGSDAFTAVLAGFFPVAEKSVFISFTYFPTLAISFVTKPLVISIIANSKTDIAHA